MYISKTRFINWTRCPMYFPMELKNNPTGKDDIDAERERLAEMMGELATEISATSGEDDDECFDAKPSPELEAMLPYYNQVEAEALKVAKRYFKGTFVADFKNVHNQKLFEYNRNGHTYRCYVDIYNENDNEINIIEVKATTSRKFILHYNDKGEPQGLFFSDKYRGNKYSVFVKEANFWHLNHTDSTITNYALKNFNEKKQNMLDRYTDKGRYPHDIAFQKFVIDNALKEIGDNRKVNYYLAVLNSEYYYDGTVNAKGEREYNMIDNQEIVTFFDMNEIAADYQPTILKEVATLESYIKIPHDTNNPVPVGPWCDWGKNTECVFCKDCFNKLRGVPDYNKANNYLSFHGFKEGGIVDKYQLINEGYVKFDDVPTSWLTNGNHKDQRDCYDSGKEYIDKEKMRYWLKKIEYPIYHFDFETFPCPLPRFKGENPYRQSVFEFSLHIERTPGVCDKVNDNVIFLNQSCHDDERRDLAEAIVDNFEFNEDGTLHGTMLAQNTGFEIGRLKELADLFPVYRAKLLAITQKTADLIHLLRTKEDLYKPAFPKRAKKINYYHKDLSGSYSIKKTLPVLVPTLTYKGMEVGNGVQAYITYLNYDSPVPTFGILKSKVERRKALSLYCQQDTWAMVEILRAVRKKSK